MIKKPTLFLILILLVGVVFILVNEKTPILKGKETPTTTILPKLLADLIVDNLNKIQLSNNISTPLILQRNPDDTWAFGSIEGKLVHQGKMQELLSTILSLTPMTYLDPSTSLNIIGLAEPRNILTLYEQSGNVRVVKIGNETAIGSGYYVQVDNNPPVVVAQYSVEDLLSLTALETLILSTPTPTPTQTNTPQP